MPPMKQKRQRRSLQNSWISRAASISLLGPSTAVPADEQALHLDQPRALLACGIDGKHAAKLQHVERREPGLRRRLCCELGVPLPFEHAPRIAPARDELFL